MKRYYFIDSDHASEIAHDDEGLESGSFEEACEEAERALREIALSTRARTIWMCVFDETESTSTAPGWRSFRRRARDC